MSLNTIESNLKDLQAEYSAKKTAIKKRLEDFKKVWLESEKIIFSELCFCICTPQSNAIYADRAIKNLIKNNALYSGSIQDIRASLKAVRFPNNKAGYIYLARDIFSRNGKISIKKKINTLDIFSARLWLVKNIKGLGFKEASHFLRNIGFGKNLAILDIHILRRMKNYGLIIDIPKSISKRLYFELEEKLRFFCGKVGIPMAELDLLFWSSATGEIFK
ncbi:8-oxoguanine DNA glycosylase/DNA lyase, thermostable [Candidatus Omnitrophus magneticus]|uniref:8-oxoguanine DNA glycosylase/AP lyase n=1 Tax=Candidatus Omnitrophus magneticus TaxID=1609969 RepID=A0A0F0CV55_9BACT|nr:8-oxoguanine DNA glycosylase/DNA lyase, thermostable [Candidatus Omnitrophus magneticus]